MVWVQAAALDLFSPKSASRALWLGLTCSCVFVYLHEQRSGTVRPWLLVLFLIIKDKLKKQSI